MSGDKPFLVPLKEAQALPIDQVGAKALRLSELIALNQPVPDGLVVTYEGLKLFLEKNKINGTGKDLEKAFLQGTMPEALEKELRSELERPGRENGRFAVRSSSSLEDGADYSMAGQFETILNVPVCDISEAIKRCWASIFAEAPTSYLGKRRQEGIPGFGVIIQKQVTPLFSGVLFTLDPVTKCADYLVLEWVEGLGDKLVSGHVNPKRINLSRFGSLPVEKLPRMLVKHIEQLKTLALHAEKHYKQPLDMEWCCTDNELFILQARPVTAIRAETFTAWTNANMAENFPEPLAPFAWSAVDAFYTSYMRGALAKFGWNKRELSRVDELLTSLNGIHQGRIFYNLNSWYDVMHLFPIGASLSRFLDTYIGQRCPAPFEPRGFQKKGQGPAKRAWNLLLFWPRLLLALTRIGSSLDRLHEKFYSQRRIWREKRTSTSLGTLVAQLHELFDLVENDWEAPIRADLSVMIFTGLLEQLIERWSHEGKENAMALLMEGIEVESTEPARLIYEMACSVRKSQELLKLLENEQYQELEARLDSGQKDLLNTFMERYGGRCFHDCMIIFPTFEERHDIYWKLVKDYSLVPESQNPLLNNENGEGRYKEYLGQIAQKLPWWKARLLEQVVGFARNSAKHRERGRLFQSLLFGEIRGVCLEIGKRLKSKGYLESDSDVFFLNINEIEELVRGKFQFPETISELVSLRKKDLERCKKKRVPEFFITDEAEYFRAQVSDEPHDIGHSSREFLRGTGVSKGVVRAQVKIVLDPSSGSRLEPGEILVTKTTDPGWTPLFFIAGGLILERGGMLSHGAIVAREFGIPAVVGVSNATTLLKDGDTVLLDGESGTVKLIKGGV